jgi:TATA-binding protein-associated factor
VEKADELITCLQILEVITSSIHKSLLPQVLESLETLAKLLENDFKAVRHMASRCIAALAHIEPAVVMQIVVYKVIPLLDIIDCNTKRQGAAEALACIIDKLQLNIVPYSVLLVVPLLGMKFDLIDPRHVTFECVFLGRMSDHDESVRLMCTHCFATLIQLMPLDGAIKEQSILSKELQEQKAKDHIFLQQLFNPKSIGDYVVPVPISAQIRSYQQVIVVN